MQVNLDGLQDLRVVPLDIDLDHVCALKALLFDYDFKGGGMDAPFSRLNLGKLKLLVYRNCVGKISRCFQMSARPVPLGQHQP